MAGVHFCYSSLKAFSVNLFLLFCAAHLLLQVSSNVAVEFSTDLNHRDWSLHSPASINRDSPLHDVGYSFKVQLIDSSFVVKDINIGNQGARFDAIISTASNLYWVLCAPCDCYEDDYLIFNPKFSNTYYKIMYDSDNCSSLPAITRKHNNRCWFNYTYADDTWIDGILSEDQFRLQSPRGRQTDLIFGCIHKTRGRFSKAGIGFMALGRNPSSFAAQIGEKLGTMRFSYCLPILRTTVGWLRFGSAAGVVSGPGVVTTPLVDENSNLYKARLEYILVQGFDNDPILIKQGDNIVIDSATQASYIDPDALQKLEKQVDDYIRGIPKRRSLENDLCYVISKEEKPEFPWITFIFHGNAQIYLNKENAFAMRSENPKVVCLAFKSNRLSKRVSIFGNLAQMGRHFEIDPNHNKLTMHGGQCP